MKPVDNEVFHSLEHQVWTKVSKDMMMPLAFEFKVVNAVGDPVKMVCWEIKEHVVSQLDDEA